MLTFSNFLSYVVHLLNAWVSSAKSELFFGKEIIEHDIASDFYAKYELIEIAHGFRQS